jgi:hypothetical protein
MKRWGLLLGAVLLLILFLASREHFSATATIKNPSSWDAAEFIRIKAMVNPASTASDDEIRRVVGGFWSVWDGATTRITLAQVNSYLDGVSNLGAKRNEYRDLIQAYYITQGQSVFETASGYSAGSDTGSTRPPLPSDTAATPSLTVERPSTSTQSLRTLIATTAGVPANEDASITPFVTQVQKFYDTVYLPDKVTPTYTQVMGFADGVDTTLLPSEIQNNFKVYLSTILQSYFTPAVPTSPGAAMGGGTTAGPADFGDDATAGAGAPQWAGTGKNVQGPGSGGLGTENTTGGLGIPRNYPVLYGGMQSYESALPSSESLGTNLNAKFAPYSRVPGDQDIYPDPYRLGKFFSTSSYSASDKPEPAPFLADFSKFFT